jgi:hypothetical protein
MVSFKRNTVISYGNLLFKKLLKQFLTSFSQLITKMSTASRSIRDVHVDFFLQIKFCLHVMNLAGKSHLVEGAKFEGIKVSTSFHL